MANDAPGNHSADRIAGLITAARGGSNEALGELLAFSREYLLLIATDELPAELQAKEGASDLVQQSQLEAVHGFGAFRGHTPAELLGWLREILRHNLQDFTRRFQGAAKRRANREVSLSQGQSGRDFAERLLADQSSPSSHLGRAEEQKDIEAALAQLPEDYRQVVLWRNRDNCSFEEIGLRLGRSADAVRKLWSRAIQQLQKLVQPSHE